jgi:hypothetical protein
MFISWMRRKVVGAKAFSNARACAVRGDYLGALKALDTLYGVYKVSAPSLSVPPFVNVFYAFLLSKAGSGIAAYEVYGFALRQLSEGMLGWLRYNADEVKYLKYYCKYILSKLSPYADSAAFKLAQSITLTHRDLRLEMVRPYMRRALPLTRDVGARLDKFLLENTD